MSETFPAEATVINVNAFSDPPEWLSDNVYIAVGTNEGGSFGTTLVEFEINRRLLGEQRLSIAFNQTTGAASIYLDDTIVATELLPVAPGDDLFLGIYYWHPYPAGIYEESRITPIERTGRYAIVLPPGSNEGDGLLARSEARLTSYRRSGFPGDSREIATELLHRNGLAHAKQWESANDLAARIGKFQPIYHHTLLISSESTGVGVDIPTTSVMLSRDGDVSASDRNREATLIWGSAMEHGVIEQTNPGRTAVSTVRYVVRNNSAGGKTFYATPANYYSDISTDPDFTAGWSASYRESFLPAVLFGSDPGNLILPEDGQQQIDQLVGNGYYEVRTQRTTARISSPFYTLKEEASQQRLDRQILASWNRNSQPMGPRRRRIPKPSTRWTC